MVHSGDEFDVDGTDSDSNSDFDIESTSSTNTSGNSQLEELLRQVAKENHIHTTPRKKRGMKSKEQQAGGKAGKGNTTVPVPNIMTENLPPHGDVSLPPLDLSQSADPDASTPTNTPSTPRISQQRESVTTNEATPLRPIGSLDNQGPDQQTNVSRPMVYIIIAVLRSLACSIV